MLFSIEHGWETAESAHAMLPLRKPRIEITNAGKWKTIRVLVTLFNSGFVSADCCIGVYRDHDGNDGEKPGKVAA